MIVENQYWEDVKDGLGRKILCRVSINSYSFGGVNVYVILEEYIFLLKVLIYMNENEVYIVFFFVKN